MTKEWQRKYAKWRRDRLRDWYSDLKKNPCTDCGETFPPYVMQFDHLRDKSFMIGQFIHRRWSSPGVKELILEEIKKCELVCANCHAIRTFERLSER